MAIEYKYSPKEFEQKVKKYHLDVETSQLAFPDLAGLKNWLAIEDAEYNAMFADPDYHDICLWAQRRRESFLNRAALTAKNTVGIKMLLAQPENGGYVEKPIDKSPRQIEVTLRGMFDGSDSYTDDDADSDSVLSADQAEDDAGEAAGAADKPVRESGRDKKAVRR